MKNIYELHSDNKGLISKSSFLRKETDFIFKVLQKEYAQSIHYSKMNMLDSYWEMLERTVEKLNLLNFKIRKNESEVEKSYQNCCADLNHLTREEEKNSDEVSRIAFEIKAIKESLWEYLSPQNVHA